MSIGRMSVACGGFLFGLALLASPAAAQDAETEKHPCPPDGDSRYDDEPYYGDRYIDYDDEPPYDYYERHWRRVARDYSRARRDYDRRYDDRFRGRQYHGDRRGWRYYDDGWHYYDDRGYREFDDGYRRGRRDGRRYAEWEHRNERGRRAYADAMSAGLLAFSGGEYSDAVREFIRAAKTNQGDPASRIHAAHAMVAIGRYHEALPALRRAFQLQPRIAYLSMDIRRDYGRKKDFDKHLQAITAEAEEAQDDPALWLLLGYYQFYSGSEGAALDSLGKSDALAPDDFMTEALLEAARRSAPASRGKASSQAKPKQKRAVEKKAKPKKQKPKADADKDA